MAFQATDLIGAQLNEVDTSAKFQLGTLCKGIDPVTGLGEFIYLGGGASVATGMFVTYNPSTLLVTVNPVTGGRGPVAVALAAVVANTFGWFQICGTATVQAPSPVVDGADVYSHATVAGAVDDAPVANEQIAGATFASANGIPAAGFAYCRLNRPTHFKMS